MTPTPMTAAVSNKTGDVRKAPATDCPAFSAELTVLVATTPN